MELGPDPIEPSPTVTVTQNVHSVSTSDGDVNIAGHDVIIHKHYYGRGRGRVDIVYALRAIRNLRKVHLDILSKATPGTGIWLFKTDRWLIWLDSKGNLKILWGSGIPGAGKSVLASIVIRELEARAAAAKGTICVAYVYIRYSDAADMTIRSVLEILVKQTVERHPDCASLAEETYAQHLSEDTQPTEAELLHLLHRFTGIKMATFYVIDALDEAPDKLQLELVKKLASLNARLFITSRPLKTVEARAPEAHRFSIAAQDDDLDLHIAQGIDRSPDLEILLESDPVLKEEVVSSIKRNCGGMFLHASLQLDALCQSVSMQDVRDTLDDFPSSVEAVYLQTWGRICGQPPRLVSLAKAVLVWVLNASRSMKIEELEHAVATSPTTYKYEPAKVVSASTLMALCRGLVVYEEESHIVRLVHYTAKDTLQRLLADTFPHPHSFLARVCITHLSERGFQNSTVNSQEEFTTVLQEDPLLAYASNAWAFHARQSLEVDETKCQTANFISGCDALPAFTNRPNREPIFDLLAPLHILALYDLPISLIWVEGISDPNITSKIQRTTPLILASWHGHPTMVQDLLRLPHIQINATDKGGRTALIMAARGHDLANVVSLLLTFPGIEVNAIDLQGWSAIVLAAYYGHKTILALLLDLSGINVNDISKGLSALMQAAQRGHLDTCALLLAHPGIDVNMVGSEGWTALMHAAEHGHIAIVALLLAHPLIQVNLEDEKGWTAFMVASAHGQQAVVEIVSRSPGIDVHHLNHDRVSALMAAAANGHHDTVKFLLSYPGTQVNLVNRNGDSVLAFAASRGCEGVVAILLAHPETQADLLNNNGQSALYLAAESGHETTVPLLLAHPGIDINQVDSEGWSPLMAAAERGHEGAVSVILTHPAIQVNLASNRGKTALMLAVVGGFKGVVARLLAHPEIQPNLVDIQGRSALIDACIKGREDMATLLLTRHDIEVNLVSSDGWSALIVAAIHNHQGVVGLLLGDHRVDVNLVTHTGWSALIGAAAYGRIESLGILLAASIVDVNVADEDGDTAIKMAADDGHEAVVRMLLEVPGIKPDVRCTRDGHTAKSIAIANGHDGVVRLLEEFDSHMVRTSNDGATLEVGLDISLSRVRDVAEVVDDSDSDTSECFEDAKEWSESSSDMGLSESYTDAEG